MTEKSTRVYNQYVHFFREAAIQNKIKSAVVEIEVGLPLIPPEK